MLECEQALANGIPLGVNLELLSGSTSDDEVNRERARMSARVRTQKLDRMQDEHNVTAWAL